MAVEVSVNPLIYRIAQLIRDGRSKLVCPSPANLYLCTEMFSVAATCLETLQSTENGAGCPDSAVLRAIRNDIAAAATLLEQAASFHGNLLHSMRARGAHAAISAGNTPRFHAEA